MEGQGGGEAQGVADPPPPKKNGKRMRWAISWMIFLQNNLVTLQPMKLPCLFILPLQ
jgi:hypothetical protein